MPTYEERAVEVLRMLANFECEGVDVPAANKQLQHHYLNGAVSLSELLENARDVIAGQKQQRLNARSFALWTMGLDKFKPTAEEDALAFQLINEEITIEEFLRS